MIPDYPKLSVVTVVRNAETLIEQTVTSVLSQDYPEIEYIIVDGQSTDRTKLILNKYIDKIDVYVSEPDQGIFDAMNKGANLASGEWVVYMNAGDYFYDHGSISRISSDLRSDRDVIFAGAEKVLTDELETRHFQILPGRIEDIWKYMPTVHQATIVRLSSQIKYKFDISYKWCADHDMLARMYTDNKKFIYNNSLLCYFDCSGGQKRDPSIYIRERWRLSEDITALHSRIIHYGLEWIHCNIWGFFVNLLKLITPAPLIFLFRRLRGTAGTQH